MYCYSSSRGSKLNHELKYCLQGPGTSYLLSLLGEDEAPSKDRVKQECEKMEAASDKIMIELFKLLELYAVCSDHVSVQQLTPEVEKNWDGT